MVDVPDRRLAPPLRLSLPQVQPGEELLLAARRAYDRAHDVPEAAIAMQQAKKRLMSGIAKRTA